MEFTKVCTAGGGVMGSQVSWQAATHGKKVFVYDAFEKGLDACRANHERFADEFVAEGRATREEVDAALARVTYTTDLAEAAGDVDVIIEQVPENLDIKRQFWSDVSKVAHERTIYCMNTSTLLPSDVAPFVNRPDKLLTLHFCVPVWVANLGEIMAQDQTDPAYYDLVVEFAQQIGLEPIKLKKEQPGYILNTVLVPWMIAGIDLLRRDVADAEAIDRTWQIANASPVGPLQMLDLVGMNVAFNITSTMGQAGDEVAAANAAFIKETYIDKGRLGMGAGAGVYDY